MSRTVGEIAAALGFEADGDLGLAIESASHPAAAGALDLALAMDPKFLPEIAKGEARAALLPPEADWRGLELAAAIFAPRPRFALAGVTALFAPELGLEPGVHPTAVVAPDARLGADVSIGPLAVVGAGATVGDRTAIISQATIGAGAELGPDCLIHPGARIGPRVRIGARVILHPNACIGADGFSFVTPEKGSVEAARESGANIVAAGMENRALVRIHSLGSVVIGDDVEIGACTAIDRGTVVDTSIGAGTKIDNHVMIGHNCVVGSNCMFCGQVGLAGSVEVGDRVVLGGKAGVADHSKIGDDAMAMASAGISGVVKARSVVGGTPAVSRDEFAKAILNQRRLPRLVEDVAKLKKRLSETERSG